MQSSEHIHFVTGKLAEPALRTIVEKLSARLGFAYSIDRLPITVAALMTPKWLLRHLKIPDEATRVVLPGYLGEGIDEIRSQYSKRSIVVPRICAICRSGLDWIVGNQMATANIALRSWPRSIMPLD